MVSVIVPVYNVEKYIEECIGSIVNQTYRDIEIILVDDGSTDNSGSICDSFATLDERIKVIHKENAGVSIARNIGMDVASGKYLIFIDSDDCIGSTYIQSMVVAMESADMPTLVCKRYTEFNNDYRDVLVHNDVTMIYDISNIYELYDRWLLNSPCNKLYDAKCVKGNNIKFPYDICIGEDLLFNIDYIKHYKPKRINILQGADYYYRKSDMNTLTSRLYENFYELSEHQYMELYKLMELVGAPKEHFDRWDANHRIFLLRMINYNLYAVKDKKTLIRLNTYIMKKYNVAKIIRNTNTDGYVKRYSKPLFVFNDYRIIYYLEPILDRLNTIRHWIMKDSTDD